MLRLTLTVVTQALIALSILLSAAAYWSGDPTYLQYAVAYMGALVAAFVSIGVWVGLRSGGLSRLICSRCSLPVRWCSGFFR